MSQENNSVPEIIVQPRCAKYYEYIIKSLFIVIVYKECKCSSKLSESSKMSTPKPNQKLKILQHL